MSTRGYPTPAEVEAADQQQLMSWSRFLPSPDDESRPVLQRILDRQAKLRAANPAGYTAASKAVDW